MKSYISCCLLLTACCVLSFGQGENWVYRYNGPGNSRDYGRSVIYGDDGNIYAVGSCRGDSSSDDAMVVSLTSTGDTNWIYRYDGPVGGTDFLNSVVYGNDGNIYAAGHSMGIDTSYDILVISLTPVGDTNWVYRYNGPGGGWEEAYAIVYGDDDRIYVAGSSIINVDASFDFMVICIWPAGGALWIYRYNGPGNDLDYAQSIVYGTDGNIYAAGVSTGINMDQDLTAISLTSSGDTNWVYSYNGPGDGNDIARSIIFGADSNIYIAGSSEGIGTSEDAILISLDLQGDTNWTYRYNGPGNEEDNIGSVVMGDDGNIYAAGYSGDYYIYHDAIVISLTQDGDTNWICRYNESDNQDQFFTSIIYGPDSNLYAAGAGSYNYSELDFMVMKLKCSGDSSWLYRYNGDGDSIDIASSVVYGTDGNVYAAGYSSGAGTSADFTVICLPSDLGVQEKNNTPKPGIIGSTVLSGSLKLFGNKNYRVFDIAGRTVETRPMKPGIYFIEVDGKIVNKIIKIK